MEGRVPLPGKKETWKMCGESIEDETESFQKMDEQKKKLQKELRDVEKLSLISKETQQNIKESLQHQLQEVERRRHDLMLEHQKVQNRPQKIQSIQDKKKEHAERKCCTRRDAEDQRGKRSQ